MTGRSKQLNPPFVVTGNVGSYEASGGSAASCLFTFYVSDAHQEGSFQLRPDTPAPMFGTMAMTVAVAYATKTQIEVTSYDQLGSGLYLVNLIRGA